MAHRLWLCRLSSDLAALIKYLPRAETTVVDAFLGPVMDSYLGGVQGALGKSRLHLMTSAGGLVGRAHFRPKDSLLSGPAGGVVGAAAIGAQSSYERVIAFDMGGTSTDVSRVEEVLSYRESHRVGDAEVMAPALRIETVAAGGGSICGYDAKKRVLYVGPESAGAAPGPACYGAGGPLTLTDINLLAHRLDPKAFGIPVFPEEAEGRLAEVMESSGLAREALLAGFLRIANERMADAIRVISVREGYDPSDYALVAFGGAGGVHACALASLLGISTVLYGRDAGLLSAYGIKRAQVERIAECQVLQPFEDAYPGLDTLFANLEQEAIAQLSEEGYCSSALAPSRCRIFLRLAGQASDIELDYTGREEVADAFAQRYEEMFGYRPEGKPLEIVKLQVVASSKSAQGQLERFDQADVFIGPQLLADATATLYIEASWRAERGSGGTIKLSRMTYQQTDTMSDSGAVSRELFTSRFRRVVDEMGMQLQRTAVSTNVKERLDYSCALLDSAGRLVANAPHIPVHLGALGLCVRRVAGSLELLPGDVVITNHPAYGGSHLPDVTVITPVFDEQQQLLGYVASRAHHAEIGGMRPGSMPVDAQRLFEEGVVITPQYLLRQGESQLDALVELLSSGPYPSRDVASNLADVRAQIAANQRGVLAFQGLARDFGADEVSKHMDELRAYTAACSRQALKEYACAPLSARQQLDQGAQLAVALRPLDDDHWCIDFSNTSEVQSTNLNATPAIVQSVVAYALRVLITEDVPLNDGLLEPLQWILPESMLNPPMQAGAASLPAVMGGNVEVSQRLVDTLMLAFGLGAQSQGTMNNTVFGDPTRSYYETLGGGAGAGEGFAGASGVHVHMTNTAITDPEILERRYPVRLQRFALRRGSGGKGQWPGGDGLVRAWQFLEPLSLSLLTQRRLEGPQGAAGGQPGLPGKQILTRASGEVILLEPAAQLEVMPGDCLVVETPGGGGFGIPS
ncbi:MAG: hydantoinase B/oxoprolinase family protein [Verrucomicrobiota bacterium]